jgi:drug/metabolite transporter (DMT)-like permease
MEYRALLLAGLTILLWGCWGFFGKLALEKHMAPTNVFLAEVCTSAVCAVPVLVLLWRQHGVASLTPSWSVFGVASGAGVALALRTRIKRLARKTICFSKTTQMHDIVIGLFVNRSAFGRAV